MNKMPELVELRAKHSGSDLAVIGINFDDDVETARAAVEEHGLSWPQVHAESAAEGRGDLWERITGIESLPRAFLVDRDGVLRRDFRPVRLEEKVAPLLQRPGKER